MKLVKSSMTLLLAAAALAAVAAESGYPSKPVRMIAPYPPGGTSDIIARIVGQKLNEAWGQQIVVDNRAGANGGIGSELAAKSPADGYTLLVGNMTPIAANPSLSSAHVDVGMHADVMVVCPATATTIARLAHGLADDMLACTALVSRAPLVVAPAMNVAMWEHPATQANLATLLGRGAVQVGPEFGRLAEGVVGMGRLASLDDVIGATRAALGRGGALAGRRVVVTAGGTHEPIDPVRFVGNRSSGKMGYALAEAARDLRPETRLVTAFDPEHAARISVFEKVMRERNLLRRSDEIAVDIYDSALHRPMLQAVYDV